MRITQSMYYKNIYGENNSQLNKKLFDVNKQIASGVNIQYAYDDIRTFTDTMRLDNEITILGQIKSSSDNGYKISDQSDVILTEFEDKLSRIRPLMIQSANDTNSDESRNAIAKELRAIESNLRDLANSSINGKYLFSGSALDVQPISDDGEYMGNDVALKSFTGTKVSQQFNISGAELFLGESGTTHRQITSNVIQTPNVGTSIDGSTTMADFNGILPGTNEHHFYLRGVQSDGTAFKQDIKLGNNDNINTLLKEIGEAYGNTGTVDVVNVTMNSSGQIVIQDKIKGSSKLDFHMIGASDFNAVDSLAAVGDIDVLDTGSINFPTTDVFVREFMKSSLTPTATAASNIEGIVYDRAQFSADGSIIRSSTSQILKATNTSTDPITVLDKNSFAIPSTKISDVADLSQGTVGTLDGTVLNLEGKDINGVVYNAQIDFRNDTGVLPVPPGSTLSLDGGITNYTIFDMKSTRGAVHADEMTYQQLMDVMNMVITGNLPSPVGTNINPDTGILTTSAEEEYDIAIRTSNYSAATTLSHDGKIEFKDLGASRTKASIALYDKNSNDFTANSSVMTFNTNNALTVNDPKNNFFKMLDEIITSVEEHKSYPDTSSGDVRNIGMQNALSMLEHLEDHISKKHSTVGSQSNALTNSIERTSLLELSTMTLRSSIIDTDLAEASLSLTQLSLNYEAMLSTVSKISRLSLVNYL